MFDLTDLWYRAFGDRKLSEDSLHFVRSRLGSDELDEEIMAHSILFLAGNPTEKTNTFTFIRDRCSDNKVWNNPKAAALLVTVLECVPDLRHEQNVGVIEFVYKAAKHPFRPVRINAMRVLRRLGLSGDVHAVAILKESLLDSDDIVKRGAEAALEIISRQK